MIYSVCKRKPLARIFTVFLAVVIALMFVSSDRSSMARAEEETKELTYISEVMIFYGNDYNDAVEQCKKAGYIPVESDLNKSAYEKQDDYIRKHKHPDVNKIYGDIGNAVVLGYKTTKERELAITNLSMLQMGIGYDSHKYEDYMELQRGKFSFMAKTIMGMRDEFSANIKKGSPAAKMALQIMNYYKYDEQNMNLGDYILSDKCKEDNLTYLFQHANGAVVNTVFSAMSGAVADYNPDTSFKEGEFKSDVKPAESIPDAEVPDISQSAADSSSSSAADGSSTEESSSQADDTSSVTDSSSADDTSSVTDSSSQTESFSQTESSSAAESKADESRKVSTQTYNGAAADKSADTEEQQVVLSCDPNYGTWADRVSKTGMVQKYNLAQIDKTDIKAYASSADAIIKALQDFAKNYQNALAREAANGKATETDVDTEDSTEMSDKIMESATKGKVTEDQADLYYLGIYDMLARYSYDGSTNLAQYIVELGSKDYATAEDKYCIYPLVAAMTHGQIEMLQYNGMGMTVTYLYNNETILKEFDKYASAINKSISELHKNGVKTISVWEGVDKKLFESSIAMTDQHKLDQSAGRILEDVKKPYGVVTLLAEVQNKINTASAILGGVNALISVGTMIYTHSLTSSFTAAACAAYMGSGGAFAAIFGAVGWFMVTACCWMGLISLALLVIIPLVNLLVDYLEKDAMVYGEIPASIVDTNNNRACMYNAVMGSNGKAGDLSAGMGKAAGKWEWHTESIWNLSCGADQRPRWNALYYTLDPDAGSPLCLDENGECFKVQYNDFTVPSGRAPLKVFNETAAANMNSYVRESDATGIYMFFTTEDSLARINQPSTGSSGQYISKIKLSYAESETEAKTALTNKGYKIIDQNLSPDRKKCYTYLGYATQTVEDKAATDIRMAPKTTDKAMYYGSASYGNAGTTKNGDSLFYTSFTQVGDALTTDFMIVNDISEAKDGYEPIASFGGLPYNFNQVLDYEVNSTASMNYTTLFESGLDTAKEKLGKPVYVFFRPSKTYSKAELEKNGNKAQQYISGISIFECLPDRNGGLGRSSWDINTYKEYVKYYAGLTGAEIYENNLLNGVKYERGWKDEVSLHLDPGEPKSFFLVTKTYNPKRAIYNIKSYTASPEASSLPSTIGSTAGGGSAAAEVVLATTARPINATLNPIKAFYGYTASHDYLNFIAPMGTDSFDNDNSGLKMLAEDYETEGYWKDAPYSKVYTNYKNQLTREYTYLRCKNIYLQGATENMNPLTPDDIAFTDTPIKKMTDGKIKALSGNSVDTEGFYSVQDAKMPNATSSHNLGFRGKDGSGKAQYIYIKNKPVEKQYIASVSVASFDVKEAAGKDASTSVLETYSKAGCDQCMHQLLMSCTDEILPYNMCVFNSSNVGAMESVTNSLLSDSELRDNLTQEISKSEYVKKLVPVKNVYLGRRVVTSRVSYESIPSYAMNDNWQNENYPSGKIMNFAYMGVSRTDSASNAVTGLLRLKAESGKNPAQTIYASGSKYTLCGGKISDIYFGDYYLYQTYDSGAGAPVTAVDFGMVPYMNGASTALYAEKAGVSTKDETSQTLGSGSSSNYIYCCYNDLTEYIDAVYVGTGDTIFDACSDLLAAGATNAVLYDVRHNVRNDSNKKQLKYTIIGCSRSKAITIGRRTRANGVRDIVFVKAKDGLPADTIELNGLTYKVARNGSGAATAVNAQDNTFIYYYTSGSDKERPLINKIGISERDRVPDTKELWENVLTSDNKRYNLNEGVFSFKDSTKFLADSRAYMFCRRQKNETNYVKPGAAIVGGHCKETMTYGDLYIEPAS